MKEEENQYLSELNMTFNFALLCGSFKISCRDNVLSFRDAVIM